jgi:hypothetical protein
MKTEEAPKTTEAKKLKRTELLTQEFGGRAFVGIDLPWRGSPKIVARVSRFFDRILEMAELPEPEQWAMILAVSQRYSIPSIWSRVRPSLLENNAAALLTALAFSNRKDWPKLIIAFFKAHKLTHGLRGRPVLNSRDRTDSLRGIQIDKLITKLRNGYQSKSTAKRKGGFASGDEQVAEQLTNHGYSAKQTQTILESRTLQDAGCRLYLELHKGEENVSLMAIRNSYARYKRLMGLNPPSTHRYSKTNKDSQ